MIRLSILICHNPQDQWRIETLAYLRAMLAHQIAGIEDIVEVLVDDGEGTIGAKRNRLLNKASGQYVCFIDDDDTISERYVALLLPGIFEGVDCCSLHGRINEGGNSKQFIHSILYSAYADNGGFYERYPNHLNCIRADIAKQFRFPEINHGEDTDWATQIHKSGMLKKEYLTGDFLYYYNPSSNRK